MSLNKWKVVDTSDVSPSSWYPVWKDHVQLPNGKVIEYFRSSLAPVSMVVAITKDHELIFVRQYKHGIGEMCIEFPAGRIEHGNTPEQAAIRELHEETGIMVEQKDLVNLGEVWTEPSKSSVRVWGFLVQDVSINGTQQLEENEDIEVLKVPIAHLDEFLSTNEVHASDTLALLFIAKMKFPDLFVSG